MEDLIKAIDSLSEKTGKPQINIVTALEDYGVISSDQGMKLFDHYQTVQL